MLNCCDGNCNQGRNCPARMEEELWPAMSEWVDRLIGVATAAMVVLIFVTVAYLFLVVAH